jgi:hypothetical protein
LKLPAKRLRIVQALVAEMVGNFGKRLKPYNMTVKELTGDMNLSRAEIEEAQVLHMSLSECPSILDTMPMHCCTSLRSKQEVHHIDHILSVDDRCHTREVGHHHPQEW